MAYRWVRQLNDDDLDERGIVKDKHGIRVSMMMRDTVDVAKPLVVDADGGTRFNLPGPIRPGPGLQLDAARRAQSIALADARDQLAWRGGPSPGDEFVCRGTRMQVIRDAAGNLAARLVDDDPRIRRAVIETKRKMADLRTANAWRRPEGGCL
jgi:hypothetical protein